MPKKKTPFWKDKAWWSIVVAAVVPAVNYFTGLNLEVEAVVTIVIGIVGIAVAFNVHADKDAHG